MEFPGHDERKLRPEFESYPREQIFDYARDHEAWLREIKSVEQLSDALEHFTEQLEIRIIEYFGSSPEITVSAGDVNYTGPIRRQNSIHMIEARKLRYDTAAPLHDRHILQGRFQGFHIGQDEEVRVYVSTSDKFDKLTAGIYIPYQSVRLEDAQISLVEHITNKRLDEINDYILTHIEEIGENDATFVDKLQKGLNSFDASTTRKLHDALGIINSLVNSKNAPPEHLIDNLIEMVQLKLRLDIPHDITASGYREIIGEDRRGYIPRPGPVIFEGVAPGIGIVGDSKYPTLALMFFYQGKAIVMPATSVTRLDRNIQ